MDGFLIIDKPIGLSSHDVVSKIKKKLKLDKVGHTGTLDPFASGLLILCVGKATKLAYLFSNEDKTYEGTLVFGKHYDTYDTTGKVLNQGPVELSDALIHHAMQHFVGHYEQIPPMYSAIKVEGQKLYDIARRGETIDREPRDVMIYEFDKTSDYLNHSCDFYTRVSKGTYIRSLAVDLAKELKTYGALSRLRRLSVGDIDIKMAKKITEVTEEDILTLEKYFMDMPSITLNDYMIKLVKNGVYLDERQIKTTQPFIVRDSNANMIAYYTIQEGYTYRPVVIF
ncbi:MAG: tRNA pseudouridine(55) synthase TruB [Acholeplasmataceae bacterium]|jgi:tRNA pseudouridine55 synthase|nr:tRNA pseudouridine(55) synthase TruB [Acholeplasmataceae bacterium]